MDIESTLAERGARYGEFIEHAAIAQNLQEVMRATPGWQRLAVDQRQSLTVIADKIARILNGDPDYIDNWHDIRGYAQLVEKRLMPAEEVAVAPSLPVSESAVQSMAANCVRLARAHLDPNARYRVAIAHAGRLGANVRDYVRDNFGALDSAAIAAAYDAESRD